MLQTVSCIKGQGMCSGDKRRKTIPRKRWGSYEEKGAENAGSMLKVLVLILSITHVHTPGAQKQRHGHSFTRATLCSCSVQLHCLSRPQKGPVVKEGAIYDIISMKYISAEQK